MTPSLALDDLAAHARISWQIAGDVCHCPGDYHRVHPLLRLIGLSTGIAADLDAFDALLPPLIPAGSRILIAGSADATLLGYFIDHIAARPLSVTIVDRCPAPLKLLQQVALPDDISLETRQVDLTEFDDRDRYDLILSHSMLSLVDEGPRLEILRRLGASLTPHGRLIIVTRIARQKSRPTAREHADGLLRRIDSKLEGFPEMVAFCGDALAPALAAYADNRASRQDEISDAAEIPALIEQAGLRLDQHIVNGAIFSFVMSDGTERVREGNIFVVAKG